MKRGLMVLAILLAASATGLADYVVIRVNLNATGGEGDGQQPGLPRQFEPDLNTGSPDGSTGSPDGEVGSPDGAAPRRGGKPGAQGPGSLDPDKMRQMMQQYQKQQPGAAMSGNPSGPGGYGVYGGGRSGMAGMAGMAGMYGGRGMAGMAGMYGGGKGGGMMRPMVPGGQEPGAPAQGDKPHEMTTKPAWFIAIVDADGVTTNKEGLYVIKHKWGTSTIPPMIGNIAVKVDLVDRRQVPPLELRLQRKHADLLKEDAANATELSPAGMLKLADWMLRHWNLPTDERFAVRAEFDKLIDKLSAKDGKDPKVQALVAAREHVRKELPSPEAELSHLKGLVGEGKHRVARSDHYAILHQPRDERAAHTETVRLEHLYAGYFYWFALQGKPLQPPKQKLMSVLAGDLKEFQQLHELFDSLPLVADGFYSRFDNVAVFSSQRIDGPYQQFRGMVSNLDRQGLELNKLIRGDAIKDRDADLVTYGRTLALALKAAQEEGDIATVTHEAVQQLAVATQIFPPRVHTPLAVKFGLGSFFETPKSDGLINTMSYWSGIGAPSWTYLPIFKKLMEAEASKKELVLPDTKITIEPLSILKIITDQGINAVEKASAEQQTALYYKSRSEAWSLTYFLAKQRLDQLLKFYAELGRLPRDMELTEEVVTRAFGRAFDLMDASGRIDPAKLAQLEAAWREFMKFQELELSALPEPKITAPEKPKEPKPEKKPPGGATRAVG